VQALKGLGHDVKDVYEAGLAAAEDEVLIDFAIRERRVLVTLDLDFGETYYLSRRGEFGVLVIRARPATVPKVTMLLTGFLRSTDLEEQGLSRSLIVIDEKRFRVVR
jgi:predicted nuclease of predicted toxin-antitoxin system